MRIALLILALLQGNAAPSGSIRGEVLHGRPGSEERLTNAQVILRGPGLPIVIRSDSGGQFRFNNLVPGQYSLRVLKDGFIRRQYGARDPEDSGMPIAVGAGQQVSNIVVRLEPAPTISGTIVDDDGSPISNLVVQAFRAHYDVRGNRILVPAFSAQTDDHGDYRLYWIDPGEYIISATPGRRPGVISTSPYVATYFDGSTEPAAAVPVALSAGSGESAISFKLTRHSTVSVRGSVISELTGGPASASVMLIPRGAIWSDVRPQAKVDADGSFELKNISTGSYIVFAQATSGNGLMAFDRVDVFSEEVKGVRLSMGKGTPLSGGFFLESAADVDLRAATVGLTPLDPGVPSAASGPVRANGGFDIGAVHNGSYAMMVAGLPGDLYVKQSVLGGVNVLDSGVEIRGAQSDSLAIVIGLDGGHLGGTVLDSADKPASNAHVVLAPVGERRKRPDQFKVVTTDANGAFALRGIPPGEYKLFAWEYVEPNAYLNAEFLARYEELGVSVRVSPGDNPPVSIRTIPVKGFSGAQ